MRKYTRAEMEQVYNNVIGARLPGAGLQGIHEVSTTQRYEIGARLQLGSKVFHYALVGTCATGITAGFGCKTRNQQDLGFGAIPAAGVSVAGVSVITVAVGAADGPAQDGSFPVDYLRGGTILIRTATMTFTRGILRNPVKAAGAGTIQLTLDAPTPVAVALANQQEGIASQYANVTLGTETVALNLFQATVGIPTISAVTGEYTWLQTWGPCAAIGIGGAGGPGGAINNLAVYCGGDGALSVFATDGGIQQIIGYTLASGDVAGSQGCPFLMLMIDP